MHHRWTQSARRVVAQLLIAAAALVALPGLASAEDGAPVVGLEIKAVDPASRTVTAVLHCVPPEKAGREVTLVAGPRVDLAQLAPGRMVGAKVDTTAAPPVIAEVGPPPCDARPQGDQPPPGKPGKPGQPGQPGRPDGGDQGDQDDRGEPEGEGFERTFLRRVWKFVGAVDGYEAGKLSVTIEKVLNLPKKFRDQDDALVDEDALVLVDTARVYEDRERVSRSALEDAEDVRVHGKLLPESKWQKDEDGEPVPTIRAKKVYITG